MYVTSKTSKLRFETITGQQKSAGFLGTFKGPLAYSLTTSESLQEILEKITLH